MMFRISEGDNIAGKARAGGSMCCTGAREGVTGGRECIAGGSVSSADARESIAGAR